MGTVLEKMLRERTTAGLKAACKHGRIGGRRPKLKPQQQKEIIRLVTKGHKTGAEAARLFAVYSATVSRLLLGTQKSIQLYFLFR